VQLHVGSCREAAPIVPERSVEGALAVGQQLGDRLLLDQPREIHGVHLGLVAGLIGVLLIDLVLDDDSGLQPAIELQARSAACRR
jgi:hypothetical protein